MPALRSRGFRSYATHKLAMAPREVLTPKSGHDARVTMDNRWSVGIILDLRDTAFPYHQRIFCTMQNACIGGGANASSPSVSHQDS
jgi:hypothetical protein